jgi:hypothetical protein
MRASIKAILCITSLVLFSSSTHAHPEDFQGWLITNAHIGLDQKNKYQLYLEAQPRQASDWKRAGTFQGRVALTYNVEKNVSLYVGYAWTPLFLDAQYHRDYRDEQLFWQQALLRHDFLGLQWQHRFRLEQRKLMRTDGISNRIRYLMRGSYALNEAKDFGLTSFDELMINLNSIDNGPWEGYDRNRIFFGPYWVVGSGRYEVGYLGEHQKRFGNDERWAHVMLVTASYTF